MPELTASQRTLRAQIAAHALHSRVDSTKHTEPARKAFLARFEAEVAEEFPDLSPAELARRANSRKNEYFKRLALKSSRARQARAVAS